MEDNRNKAIVLYDGVCGFCNKYVLLVIRKDKNDHFRFAPLQSDLGSSVMKEFGLKAEEQLSTILLLENGRLYSKSNAVFRMAAGMSGLYPLVSVFRIVPRVIRDWVYDFVAARRHRLTKNTVEACDIPDAEVRAKFISAI